MQMQWKCCSKKCFSVTEPNVFYIIVLLIGKSQPKEKSPKICEYFMQWYFWPKTNRVNHSTDKFQIKVFSNNSYATKDIIKF